MPSYIIVHTEVAANPYYLIPLNQAQLPNYGSLAWMN
ncbi:hypothetical protein HNQ93_002815 [Hymenobacter luteus]|uniref:Uncharacterized protein n=2 Tax=Hymenobacter TaxID=89966 RepID=A0A7W9T2U2_9BACT|nr:hypothetical protein [Hymenobacter latericoloratus]MBB6059955.1 hypothetical protein [Hymenobacter luteus]